MTPERRLFLLWLRPWQSDYWLQPSARFERITAHVAHWGWPHRVSPRDTHKDALWVRSEYTQRSCQPEINGFLGSCFSFIIWVCFGSCSLELKLGCCVSNLIYLCKHSLKMQLNSFSKDRFLWLALWIHLLGIARIMLQAFREIWSYSGKCIFEAGVLDEQSHLFLYVDCSNGVKWSKLKYITLYWSSDAEAALGAASVKTLHK